MKKKAEAAAEPGVKTTVVIPRPVWQAARHYAVDQRLAFRDVVVAALEMYLKAKGGKS
jgi:hypothetical protein